MKLRMLLSCLVLVSVVVSALPAQAPADVPTTEALLSAAIRKARAEDKRILVEFRASWCQWCKRLDATLTGPEFSRLIEANYVLVNLTVQEGDDKKALENPGAEDLMSEMKGEGLPYVIFMDSNGMRIADSMVMPNHGNIGYPVTPEEIAAFDGLLEKTALRMSASERMAIVAYLKKQAETIK